MYTEKKNEPQVLSLNDLYDGHQLFYWCNATGDINIPGAAPFHTGGVEDMPPAVRTLYETFWDELSDLPKYAVSFMGRYGIASNALLDNCYIEDLLNQWEDIPRLQEDIVQRVRAQAGMATAKVLAEALPNGTVCFGHDTDPDGDEIFVFVNGQDCQEHLEKTIEVMSKVLYPTFEVTFRTLLVQAATSETVEPTASISLEEFISHLSEDLFLAAGMNASPCDVCIHKECGRPVSGMVCLDGVKSWLWQKAKGYTAAEGGENR